MMQGLLASIQLSLPVSTLAVALAVLEQPVPCVPCMAPRVGCTREDLPNLQCMTCTHVQGEYLAVPALLHSHVHDDAHVRPV